MLSEAENTEEEDTYGYESLKASYALSGPILALRQSKGQSLVGDILPSTWWLGSLIYKTRQDNAF